MNNCTVCNDNDYVCEHCERADGDCICPDGPALVRCTECPDEDDAA